MLGSLQSAQIHADRQLVEGRLATLLGSPCPGDLTVPAAMRYAVLGGGQRIRPLLSLRTARMLGGEGDAVVRAAAAVELLHCASLVVDDLPCMDDDRLRRDRDAVHVAYGEANAVLAAFALVSLAARSLVEGRANAPERERLLRFQLELLEVLDCEALIGGQAMDLRLTGERRERERLHVTQLKTVPLFRLAVRAGMLLGEQSEAQRAALDRFGSEFGTAFQMADDYLDEEAASPEPVVDRMARARECLAAFGSARHELEELLDYLHARVIEKHRRHR